MRHRLIRSNPAPKHGDDVEKEESRMNSRYPLYHPAFFSVFF
jgi:hypothetical protein